jgi:hypothetical protein
MRHQWGNIRHKKSWWGPGCPSDGSLLHARAPHGLTGVLHCRRAMFGITRTFVNLSNSMAEYGFLVSHPRLTLWSIPAWFVHTS